MWSSEVGSLKVKKCTWKKEAIGAWKNIVYGCWGANA